MPGLISRLVSGGKKAAKAGAKAAKELDDDLVEAHGGGTSDGYGNPGKTLTVVVAESGEWLVNNPSGRTLRRFSSKSAAVNEAKSRVQGGGEYTTYQVLREDPSGPDDNVETVFTNEAKEESQDEGLFGADVGLGQPSLPGQDEGSDTGMQPMGIDPLGGGMDRDTHERRPRMPGNLSIGDMDDDRDDDDFPPLF